MLKFKDPFNFNNISNTPLEVRQYFVSLSCIFLDKKTLLRGTAPASLQKRRSSYYKIRKLLQNTVTLVTKCVVTRECVFLFLYHGVFSFFVTLIGNYSGSLSDAKVVKDIRPVFIKAITTGNFRKIIDSKKHS